MKKIQISSYFRFVLQRKVVFVGPALAIFSFLLLSNAICADDFSDRVVGISDGDTISVMHGGRAEKIRLYGIDAPEKDQDFGNRAKQFVSALVYGKVVKVEVRDQDRYGRTVADVFLPDGRNLNREIVKAGFAWWFRKYAPKDAELESLESEARAARRGLWADPRPVPPWEYRVLIRQGHGLSSSRKAMCLASPALIEARQVGRPSLEAER